MKLNSLPFNQIKSGQKTIELRLNDEKRQNIKPGDDIIFTLCGSDSEKIKATVDVIHNSTSFKQLFTRISPSDCGFSDEDIQQAVECMREYYPEEFEKKYGVVGIQLTEIQYYNSTQ